MNCLLKQNKVVIGLSLFIYTLCSCQCYECSTQCIDFLLHNDGPYCEDDFESKENYLSFIDSMEHLGYASYPVNKMNRTCNKKERKQFEELGYNCQQSY